MPVSPMPSSRCDVCKTRDATLFGKSGAQPLCPPCFCRLLEHRIRLRLRPLDLAHTPEVNYLEDGSAPAAVTRYVLSRMLKDAKVKIVPVTSAADHVFLPLSIEEVTSAGICHFLEPGVALSLPTSATACASMDELETFCRIKNIPFTARPAVTNALLETLAQSDPQTYAATLHSLEGLAGGRASRDKV